MKAILTNRSDIKGKDGRKWVKYYAFLSTGEGTELFLSDEQARDLAIPSDSVVPKVTIDEMFKELPTVDITYGMRGRVEAVVPLD